MSFFQNLWRDLVDKRLWPVAIVLVLVAIAVPFLIGGGSSSEDVADAGAAVTAPAADTPGEVTVIVTPDEKPRDRSGKSRDPFKPLVFAKVPKAAAAATPAKAATGVTSSAGSKPSTASPQAKTPTPATVTPTKTPTKTTRPKTTKPKPTSTKPKPTKTPATPTRTSPTAYKLKTGIQRTGAKTETIRTGLRPGASLPSKNFVLLSFLGVRRDGRTASFHVSEDVRVVGKDRKCSQGTAAHCRTLELRPGDDVRLDYTSPGGGGVKSYRFRIVSVSEVKS